MNAPQRVRRALSGGVPDRVPFILGSGCVVPRGAKKENLMAAAEAARRLGKYFEGRLPARGGAS